MFIFMNSKLNKKIIRICGLFIIPVVYLLLKIFFQQREDIATADNELIGIKYVDFLKEESKSLVYGKPLPEPKNLEDLESIGVPKHKASKDMSEISDKEIRFNTRSCF